MRRLLVYLVLLVSAPVAAVAQERMFWPEQASEQAPRLDAFYLALVAINGAVMVLIAALIIVFAWYYRRGSHVNRRFPPHDLLLLETSWIVGTLLIFLAIFAWSTVLFFRVQSPPSGIDLDIYAVARQWMWKFQHPEGPSEINELHLPVGHRVRLTMVSQDVIHSFFVPAFRVKMDVLPGRYTSVYFTPTRTGTYHLFCAEYCGTDHSGMRGQIIVMEPADYQHWLDGQRPETTLAQEGRILYLRHGCSGCHEPESQILAPSLRGLWGSSVRLENGERVTADHRYVRDAILLPQREIVAGYEPIMPSYTGVIDEADMLRLLEYIRSLSREEAAP